LKQSNGTRYQLIAIGAITEQRKKLFVVESLGSCTVGEVQKNSFSE
jgi:hypothetical protein